MSRIDGPPWAKPRPPQPLSSPPRASSTAAREAKRPEPASRAFRISPWERARSRPARASRSPAKASRRAAERTSSSAVVDVGVPEEARRQVGTDLLEPLQDLLGAPAQALGQLAAHAGERLLDAVADLPVQLSDLL